MSWIELPSALLAGEDLEPYREGEIISLFDWAENPQGLSRHRMAYRGRFLVDVVEIEANAVHQPNKPGDEIVAVLEGQLQLTDDGDGRIQTFDTGEAVLIPAGWAGLYRVIPGKEAFRELAIVPHDYFDDRLLPAPSGRSPFRLKVSADGAGALHRGRYSVHTSSWEMTQSATVSQETIVRVLEGTVTLSSDGRAGTYGKGSVLILPEGITLETATSPNYRAHTARWIA